MEWTSFTRQIKIYASVDRLYQLWATPAGLEAWFLRKAAFKTLAGDAVAGSDVLQPGFTYKWGWHNWDAYEADGQILETEANSRISFSFEGAVVTVDLKKFDDYVLVILKQSQIPTDDLNKMRVHVGCSNGWTFWLTNLKAYCEHGILLNDTSGVVAEGMGWVNM